MKTLLLSILAALLIFVPACQENEIMPSDRGVNPDVTQFDGAIDANSHHMEASNHFKAHLSGGEEVPANVSHATGQTIFRYNPEDGTMYYKLIVANIENVRMAHIHLAPAGTNGGVVQWLYPSGPPAVKIPGRTQGVLAEGTFAISESLLESMRAGNTYVNVHTDQYPGGEIRGQIE